MFIGNKVRLKSDYQHFVDNIENIKDKIGIVVDIIDYDYWVFTNPPAPIISKVKVDFLECGVVILPITVLELCGETPIGD